MARGASSAIGIDLSAAMLGIARRCGGICERLVRADGLHLPFRDSAFDFVLSSFALNHIKDLHAITRELARAMKLRGTVLISELHPQAYAQGWRPGFRDLRSSLQIESANHCAEHVMSCFWSNGFALLRSHDLFFEEPERPIFIEAGKGGTFESARHVPAVLVYEFRKIEPPNDLNVQQIDT
jgi:ubiquinone/menaquinone biosynthesis C-methylase UbiE